MYLKTKNSPPPPAQAAIAKLWFTKYKRCGEITISYEVSRHLNLEPPNKTSFLLSIRNYYTFMAVTTRNKITEIGMVSQISTSEKKHVRKLRTSWVLKSDYTRTDLDRPWGFQEAEDPIFQDGRHMKVVKLSALRTGRLKRQGYIPGYSFLLEAELTPITPTRIEAETFRLVVHCLNQLRHRVSRLFHGDIYYLKRAHVRLEKPSPALHMNIV